MEGTFGTRHNAAAEGPTIRVGAGALTVVASNTDFQAATLAQQVEAFFQAGPRRQATLPASASLRACVRAVAGDSRVKLVVSARYAGAPATVVVVGRGTGYQALIAGSNCSPTDSDIIARAVLPSGISTP
jgi:hypothetical protein